jgi:hypothetical protein
LLFSRVPARPDDRLVVLLAPQRPLVGLRQGVPVGIDGHEQGIAPREGVVVAAQVVAIDLGHGGVEVSAVETIGHRIHEIALAAIRAQHGQRSRLVGGAEVVQVPPFLVLVIAQHQEDRRRLAGPLHHGPLVHVLRLGRGLILGRIVEAHEVAKVEDEVRMLLLDMGHGARVHLIVVESRVPHMGIALDGEDEGGALRALGMEAMVSAGDDVGRVPGGSVAHPIFGVSVGRKPVDDRLDDVEPAGARRVGGIDRTVRVVPIVRAVLEVDFHRLIGDGLDGDGMIRRPTQHLLPGPRHRALRESSIGHLPPWTTFARGDRQRGQHRDETT